MNIETKIFEEICNVLGQNKKMAGIQIVDHVTNTITESTPEGVFDMLDVLLEDWVVYFDVEEDAWELRRTMT